MYGKTLAYLSKCGMIAKANIAAFVVKNCKRKGKIMSKQNLAVIFGGQSSEHEISCMSASNIIQCIDAQRYNIILVGITKEGHWVEAADLNAVQDGSWRQSKTSIVLSPDATRKGLYRMSEDEKAQFVHLDVIFPVLHGLYGEDGTVQGLFKLAGIPFDWMWSLCISCWYG